VVTLLFARQESRIILFKMPRDQSI